MQLQQKNLLAAFVAILFMSNTIQASAKANLGSNTRYQLLDPATGRIQPRTPYFLFFTGGAMQAKPLITDEKGRTQPFNSKNKTISGEELPLIMNLTYQAGKVNRDFNDPNNNNILVQAEGQGSQVFIMTLNGLAGGNNTKVSTANVLGGTPYAIWNKATSQAVCGKANKQGYSHAYYVDDSKSWYDNHYAFILKSNQPCAAISLSLNQWLFSKDPVEQSRGEQFVKDNFALTTEQYDQAYKNLNFSLSAYCKSFGARNHRCIMHTMFF